MAVNKIIKKSKQEITPLKAILARHEITQKELMERMQENGYQIENSMLSNIVNGNKTNITVKTLVHISEALGGIPLDQLIDRSVFIAKKRKRANDNK